MHLAISHKRSKLHHLYLEEAGYAYRNDIKMPGYGIRIDYNDHDITALNIVNSAGMGMQVNYNNPLSHRSVMPNSSIINTASHGLRFLSPFMTLTHVNISGSGGKGILYESNWGAMNAHTSDMASPEILKVLPLCFQNSTFVEPEKTFYFVYKDLVPFRKSCDLVFSTEPGYKITMQIIYHNIQGYQSLQIFDGANGTFKEKMWEMRQLSWQDRPVINSTGQHLFLRYTEYQSRNPVLHFFIFTVKGTLLFNN